MGASFSANRSDQVIQSSLQVINSVSQQCTTSGAAANSIVVTAPPQCGSNSKIVISDVNFSIVMASNLSCVQNAIASTDTADKLKSAAEQAALAEQSGIHYGSSAAVNVAKSATELSRAVRDSASTTLKAAMSASNSLVASGCDVEVTHVVFSSLMTQVANDVQNNQQVQQMASTLDNLIKQSAVSKVMGISLTGFFILLVVLAVIGAIVAGVTLYFRRNEADEADTGAETDTGADAEAELSAAEPSAKPPAEPITAA